MALPTSEFALVSKSMCSYKRGYAASAARGLDASRRIAIDTLFPFEYQSCKHRVLMKTAATRDEAADGRDVLTSERAQTRCFDNRDGRFDSRSPDLPRGGR